MVGSNNNKQDEAQIGQCSYFSIAKYDAETGTLNLKYEKSKNVDYGTTGNITKIEGRKPRGRSSMRLVDQLKTLV